jgi:LytS/YehU family sensor histidine kinase
MERLKKSQLEAEKFKQISMEAQFEALRSQINPHFLFNCFNVLSSLVYRDADASAKFIAQLSNVYRYLLSNQDKRVVPLQEELDFINSYGYLLSIRFGENLVIENNVVTHDEYFIPPATLQMLIENAIKHNVASKKNPLHVKIFLEGKTLIVSNNLQEKTIKETSTQIGLKNIQSRYEFLSDNKVEIIKTDKAFTVTIPLLQLEEA